MQRDAMASLVAWKDSAKRKPLIVNGARQVGKTWLVREFGSQHYEETAYVIFQNNPTMRRVFESEPSIGALIDAISAFTRTNANSGKTLIFLDEIQECPAAIQSLKLFCELRPDLPVVAAGSLLGVALNRSRGHSGEGPAASGISWPVGKVEYLDMHPLSFSEYLRAMGDGRLADLIRPQNLSLAQAFSAEYERHLRNYLFVGGMPEAVQAFADTGGFSAPRSVQIRLLSDYERDFSKHVVSAAETERIRELWRSVPRQLARESETRKFTYARILPGGRGRDYRDPVSWLADAGLVTRVSRVSKPSVPLGSYADDGAFKLFMLDVGLLGAASGLDSRTLVEGNRLFQEFKGAYAEQFVCQQMVASNACTPRYWSRKDGRRIELDFMYEHEGQVIPVEVKADVNVRSKSLAEFAREFSVPKSLRFSLQGYADEGWLVNYPLWAANLLPIDIPEDYRYA